MNRRTFVQATGATAAAVALPTAASAAFAPANINIINTGSNDSFALQAAQYNCRVIADAVREIPQFTNQGSFTTDKTNAEKRDALVRTLAAYGRAYRYVDSPGSKATYVKAYVDGVGPDAAAIGAERWDWIQSVQGYEADIAMSAARIMYMQQLNVALGSQKAVLPLEKVADMSIARDALKLLKSS